MTIALPLVGEIAVEVAVIMALLLVLGAEALVRLLAAVFSYVPLVGGWIQDRLVGVLGGALSTVSGWLWAQAKGVVSLIWRTVTWVASLIGHLADGLYALAQMGERIVTTTIPNALQGVARDVGNAVSLAWNAAHWALAQAQGFAADLYNRAVSLLGQFEGWVRSQLVAVWQDIQATAAQLWSNVVAQFHAVTDWVTSTVHAVENALVAAFDATIGRLYDYVVSRFTVTEQWVDQQIRGVESELPIIRDIAIATAEAALTPAIAHALDEAISATTTIDDYLQRCGNNLCSGLNDLSSILQGLGSLIEDGALFALVAAAAANPAAVADEVEAIAGPIVATARTLFSDATKVAA